MRTIPIISYSGLDAAAGQLFAGEPDYADVQDNLEVYQERIAGANLKIELTTKAGDGKFRWLGGYIWKFATHLEQRAFYSRQEWAMGRLRSFWFPSWRSDFTLTKNYAPGSAGQLWVEPCSFGFSFEPNRYGLWVETYRRDAHVRLITAYDEELGLLSIDTPLGEALEDRQIYRLSIIRRCRFDTDTFRWKYRNDAVGEVSARVIEVLGEGVYV